MPKDSAKEKDIDAILALPMKKKPGEDDEADNGKELTLADAQAAERDAAQTLMTTIKRGDAGQFGEAFRAMLDACEKVDSLGGYDEPSEEASSPGPPSPL